MRKIISIKVAAMLLLVFPEYSYSLELPLQDKDSYSYGGERKAYTSLAINSDGVGTFNMEFENNYKYEQVRLYAGVLLLDVNDRLVKGCMNNHHLPAPRFSWSGSTSPTRRITSCGFNLTLEQAQTAEKIRYVYSKDDYKQMYGNIEKAVEIGAIILGAH